MSRPERVRELISGTSLVYLWYVPNFYTPREGLITLCPNVTDAHRVIFLFHVLFSLEVIIVVKQLQIAVVNGPSAKGSEVPHPWEAADPLPWTTTFELADRLIIEADEFTFPFFEDGDVAIIKDRTFRCLNRDADSQLQKALAGQTNTILILPSRQASSTVALRLTNLSTSSIPIWSVQAKRISASRKVSVDISGAFGLSKAENRVLELVLEGVGYDVIAEKLFISVETVKSHMKHIFAKTNVSGRAGLLSLILRLIA
jgi:DNA-binding CsgD family transcriptional regulator